MLSFASSNIVPASLLAIGVGGTLAVIMGQRRSTLQPGDRWSVHKKFSELYGFDDWQKNHIPQQTAAPAFARLRQLPLNSTARGEPIRIWHQSCLTEWATKAFKTRGWRTRFESVANHVFDDRLGLDVVGFTELGQQSAVYMDAAATAKGYTLHGFFCGPKTHNSDSKKQRRPLTEPADNVHEGLGIALKDSNWSLVGSPQFVPLQNGRRHARGAVVVRAKHVLTGAKYTFCVFHLDHIDADQRQQGLAKLAEMAQVERVDGSIFVAMGDHNNFMDARPDDWTSALDGKLVHAVAHPAQHWGAPGTMIGWAHKVDRNTGQETREWFGQFATSFSPQLGNSSGPLLDAILIDRSSLDRKLASIEYSAHVPIPDRACGMFESPSTHAIKAVQEHNLASDHAGVFLQIRDLTGEHRS